MSMKRFSIQHNDVSTRYIIEGIVDNHKQLRELLEEKLTTPDYHRVEYFEEWAGGWVLWIEGDKEYGQFDPGKRCNRLRISQVIEEEDSIDNGSIVEAVPVDEIVVTIPRFCIYPIPDTEDGNPGLTQEFIDEKVAECQTQYGISFRKPRKNWVTVRQKHFVTHAEYREPSRPLHPYTVRLLENKMRRDQRTNNDKIHGYAVVYDHGDGDGPATPYLCLGFFG